MIKELKPKTLNPAILYFSKIQPNTLENSHNNGMAFLL